MKSWRHEINEVTKCTKSVGHFLVNGETVLNGHIDGYTKWSYVIDSQAKLIKSIPSSQKNHYNDTYLYRCVATCLDEIRLKKIYDAKKYKFIFDAEDNGRIRKDSIRSVE